jgi:hypothetical protein
VHDVKEVIEVSRITSITRFLEEALPGVLRRGGDAGNELRGIFAGRVEGSDAFVQLVVGSGGALASVCDGRALREWAGGRLEEGRFAVVSRSGVRLEAHVTTDGVRGTLALPHDERLHAFAALPAASGERYACVTPPAGRVV